MPEINFNQAKELLEKISKNDTVAVIHHDDGDGYCSGILYYEFCESKGAKVEQFTYNLRKTKLRDFDLTPFNKIILTDLTSDILGEQLFELQEEKEILFFDHHKKESDFPKNTNYLITTNEGYIPASRTAEELTNENQLLGLIGTITDAGQFYQENQEYISEKLKESKTTLDEFQKDVSSIISNAICYLGNDSKTVFNEIRKIHKLEDIKHLKKYSEPIENEVEYYIKDYEKNKEELGDINFYYFNPKYKIKGIVAGIISHKTNQGAYIFASKDKDNEDKITLAARTNSDKYNMPEILRTGIKKLEDSNAGGHIRAAGGIILTKDLEQFKQNIRDYVSHKNN